MKKQKFEVGQRIAFTIYSGRHKGKIINVTENFIVVHCAKRNEIYSFWFTHSEYESYKIKRLVKKKKSESHASDAIRYMTTGTMDVYEKPVVKRSAREWYIRPRDDTDFAIDCLPKIVKPIKGHGYILVREVLDEEGET